MHATPIQEPWTDANWCVDDYRIDDGALVLSGWAVPAREGRASDLALSIDGRRLRKVLGTRARPDVAALFPERDGSAMSGFEVVVPRRRARRISETSPLRVSLAVAAAPRPELDFYYAGEIPPVPPGPNRERVGGHTGLPSFYLEGYSAFRKIEGAVRQAARRGLDQFGTTLDWGVGCGRVARYLRHSSRSRIVGIDVDPINIAWCRDHLPWLDARLVDVTPPTELADHSIDLVIGVSVLSHLREADMMAWLQELHRVTAPGAVLALTTHGRVTFSRTTLGDQWFHVWQELGFMDGGRNPNIDGADLDDADYYRNVFVTERYLRSAIDGLFDLLAFHEGVIGNSQDLTVLRRP